MTFGFNAACRFPCSSSPAEEFQGPDGTWFSVHRAIVLDGWLTWRDAFPELPLRGALDHDVACHVTALAQRIHALHMSLPEYRRTVTSPFQVGQWWDPAASDQWSSGDRVLLKINQYTAQRLIAVVPARIQIVISPKSENWVEISLPDETDCPIHSLDYNRVVTTES